MNYQTYLAPDQIIIPAETSKNEVILQLAALAAEKGFVDDREDLAEKLFYRESLMSTGIGLGLGVPHVRYPGVSTPMIALAIQPQGIKDYDSLDGDPVRIAMLILVGEGEHKLHVRLLSQITRQFKSGELIERVCACSTAEEVFELLSKEPVE